MKHLKVFLLLLLVAPSASAQTKTAEVKADSLLLLVQAGDSCMRQYNTFEALKYYQEAYAIAKTRSQQLAVEQPDLPLDKFDELPEEKQDEIIEHLKQSAEKSSIVDCMVQMKLANCHYKTCQLSPGIRYTKARARGQSEPRIIPTVSFQLSEARRQRLVYLLGESAD